MIATESIFFRHGIVHKPREICGKGFGGLFGRGKTTRDKAT